MAPISKKLQQDPHNRYESGARRCLNLNTYVAGRVGKNQVDGLERPSFLIRDTRVLRFISSSSAALPGPATFQPVASRTLRMCSRSISFKARLLLCPRLEPGNVTSSVSVGEPSTARAIMFLSSRMLHGLGPNLVDYLAKFLFKRMDEMPSQSRDILLALP